MDNKQAPSDRMGILPPLAPLANPYVPFQPNGAPQYPAKKGMLRGTLFPGLDLPFMGMVNTEEQNDTPCHELMALNFAIIELTMYLDTHQSDTEAAELLQAYISLYEEGKAKYEKQCGPFTMYDGVRQGKYLWSSGPWPWEYRENGEA